MQWDVEEHALFAFEIFQFLADRINARAYATVLRPSVVSL